MLLTLAALAACGVAAATTLTPATTATITEALNTAASVTSETISGERRFFLAVCALWYLSDDAVAPWILIAATLGIILL